MRILGGVLLIAAVIAIYVTVKPAGDGVLGFGNPAEEAGGGGGAAPAPAPQAQPAVLPGELPGDGSESPDAITSTPPPAQPGCEPPACYRLEIENGVGTTDPLDIQLAPGQAVTALVSSRDDRYRVVLYARTSEPGALWQIVLDDEVGPGPADEVPPVSYAFTAPASGGGELQLSIDVAGDDDPGTDKILMTGAY